MPQLNISVSVWTVLIISETIFNNIWTVLIRKNENIYRGNIVIIVSVAVLSLLRTNKIETLWFIEVFICEFHKYQKLTNFSKSPNKQWNYL